MNISIPTSIYTSVEKYDQSEQAKMLQLQKAKKSKTKRNLLGTPDYLIDIPDPAHPFSNQYQKRTIKKIIESDAPQRHVTHLVSTESVHIDKLEETLWAKLSNSAKRYLTCLHIDSSKVNKFSIDSYAVSYLSGVIYTYKKIWVAMYFPDAYAIDFDREVLINYSFMFKLGTKSSNLSCMQQVMHFAETIGYGSTNPVSFEQVTASSGDVFIKAQLTLTKEHASWAADKSYKTRYDSIKNTKVAYFYLSKEDKCHFWTDLHPFYESMSIKLQDNIISRLYSYPDWYFYLSSGFKIDKTDFYPAAYQAYIGSDTQPDAKKFISFIEICLKNTLTQWVAYQDRYSYGRTPLDTVKTVFQWHDDRIKSFIKKIDTPKFRSIVHKTLSLVYDLEQQDLLYLLVFTNGDSCKGIEYLFQLVKGMYYVHSIWPNTPIDSFYATLEDEKSYILCLAGMFDNDYQSCISYEEAARSLNRLKSKYNLPFFLSEEKTCSIKINQNTLLTEWLHDNIDPVTFINWMKTSVNEIIAEYEEQRKSSNNENTIITLLSRGYLSYARNSTLLDVMNMITDNMSKDTFKDFKIGKTVSLEKMEQALIAYAIKNDITNGHIECLPMDLFPEPVEVVSAGFDYRQPVSSVINEKTWKFLQPKTTKHLQIWGERVRNCVGTSTSYYTNMKNHKALIILACIDNKPRITIYAELKDKQLNFTQVKDKMNQSLSDEQQFLLKNALNKAFQQMTAD